MGSIYSYGSQESLTQNFYPTQGVNETYSAFACRVSGVKVNFAEPDQFLRRMSSESSNSSQGSFKAHLGYASTSEKCHNLTRDWVAAAQRYHFHMRTATQQNASSRNNDRAAQDFIDQPEIQNRDREAEAVKNRTILQRLLHFITRCFMPCINVKR